jgi:Lrp/AsnC family leucine-responsive transcriptional regulator
MLDRFDLQILKLLQTNNRLTYEEIGERVGLSASACRRRIDALRESGVIEADVSIVNALAIGREMLVITTVVLQGNSADAHEQFRREMSEAPEVMQCYFVAGAVDYVLVVSVASLPEYEAFTARLLRGSPRVQRFESLPAMQNVKRTTALPIG